MSENKHGLTSCMKNQLYREFALYYEAERCQWAPLNPKRVFELAFGTILREYEGRVTGEELLGLMYTTLGFPGAEPPGLFQKFDPRKYHGVLTPENHFVNLFGQTLRGRLDRAVARTTDNGRKGNRSKFRNTPALGLVCERVAVPSERAKLVVLPALLEFLDERERLVISLTYWGGHSSREVGDLLGMHHTTVLRVRDAAVAKLRYLCHTQEHLGA
ncbi:RNA polymerase sigma factor SigB [Gemmata sp. SH-PL17]|uniref:sigma factor-like helix-turn-helix DNA-binding protein n=1 Tax=Gemmata sp. SH-PL17 TaxID=1630693 RepID=UPI00078E7CE2|nr:sigma factor-like helix-turn-helix DNA-binding protein [Gemmata sp. SH-PL17]AMV29380.1 RNA polymerase sigma factor SigB [Gemmata sp. SH-PL17]